MRRILGLCRNIVTHTNMQRSTGTNTNTSAASQACAVCRYQRKKCTPNCPLAPFFPASNHKDFLNTRKLFGVRNITKLVENLNPQQKVIAIKSMIFEANIRAKDPVGGCYRIICELQRQIDWNRAELELVLYQLSICKSTKEQQSEYQVVKVVDDDRSSSFFLFLAFSLPLFSLFFSFFYRFCFSIFHMNFLDLGFFLMCMDLLFFPFFLEFSDNFDSCYDSVYKV